MWGHFLVACMLSLPSFSQTCKEYLYILPYVCCAGRINSLLDCCVISVNCLETWCMLPVNSTLIGHILALFCLNRGQTVWLFVTPTIQIYTGLRCFIMFKGWTCLRDYTSFLTNLVSFIVVISRVRLLPLPFVFFNVCQKQ